MEIFKICLTTVLSIIELFFLTKIMGKRQVSQLSLFDYINGITIGSIAADMAFSPLNECWKPAVAIVIYGIFSVLFSVLANKLRCEFPDTDIIVIPQKNPVKYI